MRFGCAISFSLLVGTVSFAMDDVCLKTVVEIAFTRGQEERIPHELQALSFIKNTEKPFAATYDFTNPLSGVSERLSDIVDEFHHGFLGKPSQYEEAVLSLNKGDRVMFGKRYFTLGRFLGAGNTTHIYRLAHHPEYAIRIPLALPELFPKLNLETREALGEQEARMQNHYAWTKYWSQSAARQVGTLTEIEIDEQGRFLVVPYVRSQMNGFEYLSKIAIGYGEFLGKFTYPGDFTIDKVESDALFQGLLFYLKKNGHITRGGPDDGAIIRSDAEQYLLDVDRKRWWLVDPEDYSPSIIR